MRGARTAAAALALCGLLAAPPLAAGRASGANGQIVGDVLVCNGPGRCFTQAFEVSATNRAGRVVAHTQTTGTENHFLLRVAAGRYDLLAVSAGGLRCSRTGVSVAPRRTVTANITCLVP